MSRPMQIAAAALLRAAPRTPDRWAQLADARTALCLAHGTAIGDIDPASGYNTSWEAYQRSRDSWVRMLAEEPASEQIRRWCREAERSWALRRPEHLRRQPWPVLTCATCGTPEAQWDRADRLYREESAYCPHCLEAQFAAEEAADQAGSR